MSTRPRRLLRIGLPVALCLLSLAALTHRAPRKADEIPLQEVPKGWPAPHYQFKDNPVTAAGFALGRKLFYDARLSRDGSVSCGSCHQQFAAFSQLGHRVSHGIGGVNGKRNAPGLFNLAWQPQLMWDGAATHLETQAILPISNPLEMGESLADIVSKLQADSDYPLMFAAAFGTPAVDSQRVLRALAQFTGSLVSNHSRYDRYIAGEEKLSANELSGLGIFRSHCAACHREPLFSDFNYRSNGLDAIPQDEGRSVVTARPEDRGLFRVPSLRNVALTAPYMHDGRYDTLEQVLDHYDHGVVASPALDPLLARGIALSQKERQDLLSFLNTLTDQQFINDVRFANVGQSPPKTSPIVTVSGLLGRIGLSDSDAGVPAAGSGSQILGNLGPSHLTLQSKEVELVLVHQANDLVIYADAYGDNAPLAGLNLLLRIGNQSLRAAEEGEGVYRIPAEQSGFLRPQAINLTLRGSGIDEQFQGLLPADAFAESGP
jgi:cytochrome c peroxidase